MAANTSPTAAKKRPTSSSSAKTARPPQTATDELQSIPARHGTATFVPRGQTIKVVNTYGKQVVATWIFALHGAPEEGKDEQGEEGEGEDGEEVKEKGKQEDKSVKAKKEEPKEAAAKEKKETKESKEAGVKKEDPEKTGEKEPQAEKEEKKNNEAGAENKSDQSKEGEDSSKAAAAGGKTGKTWSSYLPSIRRGKGAAGAPTSDDKSGDAPDPDESVPPEPNAGASAKSGWSAYIPSLRRGKGSAPANTDEEEAAATANSKRWSEYIPSGKAYSSYLPSSEAMSAFAASHARDPSKTYAEQLYDFSKTPVGAAGLSAATGSGLSSSLYAAYSAYTKIPPSSASSRPPMEYLSLAHTNAALSRASLRRGDVLLSNLRAPLATLVEDTTPGAHGTLTPACDAPLYAALGVARWEEHGSCAENLVVALREMNERAGLRGPDAVGADVTVNIAPTPLHLFMNCTLTPSATIEIATPQASKRSFVRLRAERDVVVVMSACPMEVGPQNGGRCMAANFVVEEAAADSDDGAEEEGEEKEKKEEKKGGEAQGGKGKEEAGKKEEEKGGEGDKAPATPRKKPKKLEKRT